MTSRPAKRTSTRGSAPAPAAPREPDVVEPEPATVPTPAPPDEETARRAGGHVDRGDGRGWVLDDEQED